MPKRQQPANYCPITFLIWTPENDSALDYEWTPLPKRVHIPLKVRAHRIGLKIAAEELADLRQRLAAVGEEVEAWKSLMEFRKEFDGLQAHVRKMLGVER